MYTKYHYDACIGGKTGYTSEAKNTLVTYAEKDGHTLACVVMENSDGHIYPDTINAMDYCFDHYDQLMAQMATLLQIPKPRLRPLLIPVKQKISLPLLR